MAEIDDLKAERDALKVQNDALTDHARQLISQLAAKPAAPDPPTSDSNTKSRADFEKMDAQARMTFIRSGGRLTD